MKKTRILALVLIVAMALTGAGYAFWTETLTIENTVRTGMLDFIFDEVKTWSTFQGVDLDTISFTNNQVNDNKDSGVSFGFRDMYPGSEAFVSFYVFNNGTMDGKLEEFELTGTDYDEFIYVTKLYVHGLEDITEPFPISELEDKLNDLDIAITEGNTVYFEIGFKIADCAKETDVPENLGRAGWDREDEELVYTLTAKGRQWNDNGQCDEDEDPDPTPVSVITGLRLHITENKGEDGKYDDDRIISGDVYYTWSEGKEDTYAGKINNQKIKDDKSFERVFGDFRLIIENDDGDISWRFEPK